VLTSGSPEACTHLRIEVARHGLSEPRGAAGLEAKGIDPFVE
jgi:hypothetical protein